MFDIPVRSVWLDEDVITPVAAALAHIGSHFHGKEYYDEIEAHSMIKEILEKNPLNNQTICLISKVIEVSIYDPEGDDKVQN